MLGAGLALAGTDGGGLAVVNPATGAAIASVRDHGPQEVAALIEAAAEAWPAWRATTARERAALLIEWHRLVLAEAEALAALMTAESGKPLAEARGEVAYGAAFIAWFAEEAKRAYGEITPSPWPGRQVLTLRQPVGVCAAITPWNFPLAMITRKVAPALAAGCPILVKPAEATPLTALALETLAHRAGIPEDVFRVVPTGRPAEIGALFCASPRVRKLSFTGSTRVGKLLMRESAATVKRVSMELGGNAPFIVFADADVPAAVEGALASKYRNAGQTCVCANRFLVADAIHDEFVEALAARVAGFRLGDGAAEGVTMGPLIDAAAAERVGARVGEAVALGAEARIGGHVHDLGAPFFAPTVLTGVTPEMTVAREETFGPVAPVIRFRAEDEAIRIANATPYGLAAYFYTRDPARIWRVMAALEFGMVGVNEGLISTEVAPFGGVKESGVGREGSRHGLDEYLEHKYCLWGTA